MPRINLLPWREELRRQRRTEYLSILGACALAAAGVWFAIHMYFNALIEQQQRRNSFLTAEIKLLDKKIAEIKALEKEKENLIARMKAIETLQTSRPIVVHLFDELVSTLPDGVYLTSINQSGENVTVKGVAQSNARVSNYMRNVEASEWERDPKLSIIQSKSQDGKRTAEFTLTFKQIKTKTSASEDEEQL
ncbi:MAG: PilN domain-containing protein [Gammaproteobacteria bacterium]|nr:PilN domain-containing protein [Gammaproteobacteria bacterium]